MKLKRKHWWGIPAGIKQFHMSSYGTERSLPGEFSLFLLCVILYFASAFEMLRTMFGWEIGTGSVFRIAFFTVAVSALTEASVLLKGKWETAAKYGIPAVSVLGSVFYLFCTRQGEEVISGLAASAGDYIGRWNRYFKTSYPVPEGTTSFQDEGLVFLCSVLCIMLVWLGRVIKRVYVTATVPVIVLAAGLLVGKAPTGVALFLLAAAVLLSNASVFQRAHFLAMPDKYGREAGNAKYFLWIPVAVCVLILCLTVKKTGTPTATEFVDRGMEKMVEKQNEMLEEVVRWDIWKRIRVAAPLEKVVNDFLEERGIIKEIENEEEYALLDNSRPSRSESVVMRLVLDKKPASGTYLIGFFADTYEKGMWSREENFADICEENGISAVDVAKGLLKGRIDWLLQYKGQNSMTDAAMKGIRGTLFYVNKGQEKTYAPYFTELLTEGIGVTDDGRYVKKRGQGQLSFVYINYYVNELVGYLFQQGVSETPEEKEAWEKWYETYVEEQYLTVPAGMEQVEKVAEAVRLADRNFLQIDGKASVNVERLNLAYKVAEWMRRNTTYSLDLPEIPFGVDPVEFFLGESRQGYCKHYAGAATLILRQLGVPARYVSGYIAGDYTENESGDGFVVDVRQRDAHSWVEIYLEGIGWIPMEVTKGYSVLPLGERIYYLTDSGEYREIRRNWGESTTPSGDGYQQGEPGSNPSSDSSQTPSGDSASSGGKDENYEEIYQVPGDTEEENTPEEGTSSKPEKKKKKSRKLDLSINPVILVLALPVFWILVPIWKALKKAGRKIEEKHFRLRTGRYENRQKITLLNQKLYTRLRRKGRIWKRRLRDTEYDDVLEKFRLVLSREERERYMHLVKAAAFSEGDFTDEEVEFCKQVYQKVLYEKGHREDDRE